MTANRITSVFLIFVTGAILVACQPTEAEPKTAMPTPTAQTATATVTPTPVIEDRLPEASPTSLPEGGFEPSTEGLISPENAGETKILQSLQGHEGQIIDFVFLSDDGQVLSLASDLTLKRWDTNSGEELSSLKLQGGPIYNGAISPVGDVFAIEGPNHMIEVRDSQEGQVLREMTGHSAFVMGLTFSQDGSFLATGDSSGSIRLWETETSLLLDTLAGHTSPVGALVFSPDNTLLASGGVEGSQDIKIWNLVDGEEIASLEKHTGNVYDLAFSPDGTVLASASGDRTLRLWDVVSGEELQTFRGHRSNIYSVGFSPDGRLLASSDFDGNIKLLDAATGMELINLKGHTDLVEPVKFSSKGCLLASGSFDATILLWGIPGSVCSKDAGERPSLDSSGGGLIAFTSDRDDGEGDIYTMNADGSDLRRLTDDPAYDAWPTWSPDGSQIAFVSTRSGNPDIFVMDADGSNLRQLIDHPDSDFWPEWSPDGARIAFVSRRDGNLEIYVIDVDGTNLQRLTNTPAADDFPAWSPDSAQIVFSRSEGDDGTYIMNADGSDERKVLDFAVLEPAWSPDGSKIIFGSDHEGFRGIYVMDVDGSNLQRLSDTRSGENCPSWSSDGTQIVFASWRDGDGEIYVMDADGNNLRQLTDNRFEDEFPAWRPAAKAGGGARTWIRTFEGPDYGAFFDITLTEDGNILAVGATNHLHFPPYSGDAFFMKLALDGDVLWERTWGGDGYEQAWSVVPADNGGYYIFGETDSYGAGDRDFFLLKITADGSEDWFRTYGRAYREWPYGMLRLSNGDLLIYGFTEPLAGSGRNQYALRVGLEGEVIWEYSVESPEEELVLDALETKEGDLILAVVVDEDGKLVKLDSTGNPQWENRYELAGWQYASQIAQIDGGGFLLAGFSMSSNRQADTWLAGCTSTGELVWETSFGDSAFDDYAVSLMRLGDGTYLLGGLGNGILLSRVDEDGNVLWRHSLVGQSVYGAMGLVELEDGGYLVAGLIQITNGRSYDAILLRTDAEGWVGE